MVLEMGSQRLKLACSERKESMFKIRTLGTLLKKNVALRLKLMV